jgi:hypothetical protein
MTTTTESPDDLLTNGQAARVYGVQPDTWRKMVQRGQAPNPDGREPLSDRPYWRRETVVKARDAKPGHGFRSDLTRRCVVDDPKAGLHKGRDVWAAMVRTKFGTVLSKRRVCEGHVSHVRAELAKRGNVNDDGHTMTVEPWPRRTSPR